MSNVTMQGRVIRAPSIVCVRARAQEEQHDAGPALVKNI